MTDKSRPAMSDAEREVLKVLWEHGPLAVRDVLKRLTDQGQEWTRSTAITLLQRLEKKGYVKSDRSQFAFVFRGGVAGGRDAGADERLSRRTLRRRRASTGARICRTPSL